MARPNAVPYFEWRSIKLKPGTRVRIRSRHGSTGTGTVTEILTWHNAPDTICLNMDADTIYAPMEQHQPNWEHDSKRIAELGVFGGEIKEVMTVQ